MTKVKRDGSQDLTSVSLIHPKVFDVVTTLNNRVKEFNARQGSYKISNLVSPEEMIWIDEFLKTGSMQRASKRAYGKKINNDYHARNLGLVKMDKPLIKKSISMVLHDGDGAPEKVAEEFIDILHLRKKGATASQGDRIRVGEALLKMQGAYAPEQHININADAKDFRGIEIDQFERETLELIEATTGSGPEIDDSEVTIGDGTEAGS
jgi:hypothetical protein